MEKSKDQFLLDLVDSGKTLATICDITNLKKSTVLNKLKKWGVADKSLEPSDCLDPEHGTRIKKVMEIFTYEDFLEKIVKEGRTRYELAQQYGVERQRLRHAIKKYKDRYLQETGITL